MIIESVIDRLYPGKRNDIDAQNEAATILSESTYQLIEDLVNSIEEDLKAAPSRQK